MIIYTYLYIIDMWIGKHVHWCTSKPLNMYTSIYRWIDIPSGKLT